MASSGSGHAAVDRLWPIMLKLEPMEAELPLHKINEIFLKKNFRLLTGRESARLQGFPDSFKIHSNDKIAKKQFGNAVPTNVVYNLAKEVLNFKKSA